VNAARDREVDSVRRAVKTMAERHDGTPDRAVTSSTKTRASMARPYLRTSQPMPLPMVSPAMPTLLVSKNGVARPCSAAAAVYVSARSPGWAHARRRSGSMCMPFVAPRSTAYFARGRLRWAESGSHSASNQVFLYAVRRRSGQATTPRPPFSESGA